MDSGFCHTNRYSHLLTTMVAAVLLLIPILLIAEDHPSPAVPSVSQQPADEKTSRTGQTSPVPSETAKPGEVMKMTLVDCVVLALRNNLDLKGSFLDRTAQRFALKVAERMFTPRNFLLSFSSDRLSVYGTNTYNPALNRTTDAFNTAKLTGTWAIPTGGTFTFNWLNMSNRPDVGQNVEYTGNWSVTFAQPLLRGGPSVATAPLTQARLTELNNISVLKDAMMNTITSAISKYRAYLSAVRQLGISRTALESSRNTYEINKELIAAGRMAPSEIVQAQYDIANQESSVESSTASVDSARLDLIQFLDLSPSTQFEVEEEAAPTISAPSMDQARAIALAKRTDYERELRAVESADLTYKVAKNGLLWDLSFALGAARSAAAGDRYADVWDRTGSAGKSDWAAGLVLNIPILDLSYEQTYVNAKVSLEKEKLALKKLQMTIEVDIKNKLRDVAYNHKQWELQKQALVLAQKRYETEQEKLAVGRSSNFQLFTFQNDLARSRVSELTARIGYLNALNSLDNGLGTTLDSWGIRITSKDDVPPVPAEKPGVFGQESGR